jgi:hypothetical protein
MSPIERLINQRDGITAAATETIALIGIPSPFSTSGSKTGLLRIGVVNRLFGRAAFSFESGV